MFLPFNQVDDVIPPGEHDLAAPAPSSPAPDATPSRRAVFSALKRRAKDQFCQTDSLSCFAGFQVLPSKAARTLLKQAKQVFGQRSSCCISFYAYGNATIRSRSCLFLTYKLYIYQYVLISLRQAHIMYLLTTTYTPRLFPHGPS